MENLDNIATNNDGFSQAELEIAGIGMRICAFIIDHVIIVAVLMCPSILFMLRHMQSDPGKAWTISPVLMLMAKGAVWIHPKYHLFQSFF